MIKTLMLAAALAASTMLAACGTLSGGAGLPTSGGIASQTVLDEKALLGLESAAVLANEAAATAVRTGVLRAGSPQAIRVADLLVQLRQATLTARRAHQAANNASYTQAIAEGLGVIADVGQVLGVRIPVAQ